MLMIFRRRILPFANNIYTPRRRHACDRFQNGSDQNTQHLLQEKRNDERSRRQFYRRDVLEGLTAVISVKLREIQFEGQTKAKLGSMEAQGAVATVFGEAFATFLGRKS